MNWFVLYLPYFLTGYLLRYGSMRVAPKWLIPVFCGSVLATVLGYHWLAQSNQYFYEYLSITVIPMSLSAAGLLRCWDRPVLSTDHARLLANLTLGVYLVHPLLLNVWRFAAPFSESFPAVPQILITSVVIIPVSFLLCFGIKKIPCLRASI